MVLRRADKDEIAELITSTLDKYLSDDRISKNLTTFENTYGKGIQSLKDVTERLEAKIIALENENTKLRERFNDHEQDTLRNSLRMFGVEEEDKENVYSKIKNVFEKVGTNTEGHIERCQRIGKKLLQKDVNNVKSARKKNVNGRCIVVKFTTSHKRNEVLKKKKLLKSVGVSISEDLTFHNYDLFKKAKLKFDVITFALLMMLLIWVGWQIANSVKWTKRWMKSLK
ncbi:putative transcription by RNA polymerase III [Trypoxylus dichotomus]